jgi:sugar/nucleoside kinase (ribokinase family)
MGKVGDDVFGQAVCELVRSYDPRLAEGMVVDQQAHTSYTVVLSPPGVDRFFLHHPGANDTFSARDVRYDQVAQVRLFHFGYPPIMRLMYTEGGTELTQIFRCVKESGVTTSLDMALPDPTSAAGRADWVSILKATMPYVDVFLPSIEEILYMLRRQTYQELYQAAGGPGFLGLITPELLSSMSQELLDIGAKIVVLKLGDRGLYLRTADRAAIEAMGHARPPDPAAWADKELWSACFKVDVVGTAGSGDSTIAGFLSALLRGLSPEPAVTAAVAVGACNVEAADTLSGVRPWEETMRRVAGGWARHELNLDAPGWRFDADHQLWVGGR